MGSPEPLQRFGINIINSWWTNNSKKPKPAIYFQHKLPDNVSIFSPIFETPLNPSVLPNFDGKLIRNCENVVETYWKPHDQCPSPPYKRVVYTFNDAERSENMLNLNGKTDPGLYLSDYQIQEKD